MREQLKEHLLGQGASVIGIADVGTAVNGDIAHLRYAVSIGISGNLRNDTLNHLGKLQQATVAYLKKKGYRYLVIPPDSDRVNGTFISRLYSLITHKLAATSAGLGWIGKNGLLISAEFGPKLSLATVLTDAPFETDNPIENSRCGSCNLCVDHCPSGAITGECWSRSDPYPENVRTGKCMSHKQHSRSLSNKPNCGLCINICPYGRKITSEEYTVKSHSEDV